MDRTASAGVEQGEEIPAELPFRRPSAREPEAGGDRPSTWFGDPKPGDGGSSPAASSDSSSTDTTTGATGAAASPASREPGSLPPEFGPASPGGPGRVSFGFDDGPIGGARAGRSRGDEPDSLPQRNRAGSAATDTGDRRRNRADGSLSETGELRRNRADGKPAASGETSRRRGVLSEELPVVRKAGNGEPVVFPADPEPSNTGTATRLTWPESFEAGPPAPESRPPAPLAGLAAPLWPDSGDAGSPRVSGTDWDRRDEPIVWADTPAAPAVPAGPAARPRPRLVTAGMALLGVVALAAVALTGIVYYSGDDNQISDILGGGSGSGVTNQRIATGPLADRTVATFEMLAATDRVQLRIADLGDELYRISSPEGAGVRPSADLRDDRLRVDLTRDNAGTGGEVEVLLAAKVRWTIRFSGYSAERIVDLSAGRVKGIEMVGGTRRAEMTLAQAAGTVPMKITGGVEELTLRAPTGSPVRIKVGGGAGTVTAGSRTLRDVAPGSTLTPKDWTTGNRYDIDAVAPVTLLTVETA